jgi:hypothetical protein
MSRCDAVLRPDTTSISERSTGHLSYLTIIGGDAYIAIQQSADAGVSVSGVRSWTSYSSTRCIPNSPFSISKDALAPDGRQLWHLHRFKFRERP